MSTARRLLAAWTLLALVLTLSPFAPLRLDARAFLWVPPWQHRIGWIDFAINLALFLPIGLLALRAGARRSVAIAGALALSLSLECAQMLAPLRTPSPFDVLANTLGAAVGTLIRVPGAYRLDRPVVRALTLAAGALAAAAIVDAWPGVASYGPACPFGLAITGAWVAAGLWRPWIAATLATIAVAVLAPTDAITWLAYALPGAITGAWAATCDASQPARATPPASASRSCAPRPRTVAAVRTDR